MKEGWTYKKLGEVGSTQTGTTPSKSNPDNYGDHIPFIRPAEISADGSGHINYDSEIKLSQEGLNNGRLFKKGSILMVCIGTIGKLGFADENISCNQQINVLTPNEKYVPKYVFYAMSNPSFQRESLKIAQGAQATIPIINKGKWSNLLIPIPPTMDEQKRIVSRLDSAFSHIDELKANAEKQLSEARALFQKSLAKAMEPKEGWEEKTLKEICSVITDGTHHSPTNLLTGKYKYITAKNIKPWGLDLSNITYVSEDVHREIIARCNPQKGDVLYIKDGATTGIAIINPLDEEISILSSVALIRPQKKILLSKYLCYALNSPSIYKQTRNQMDGAAITRVTLVKIKGFSIPLPSLLEQQRIVKRLDALSAHVRELEENQKKIISECDALKQALLRKVFE